MIERYSVDGWVGPGRRADWVRAVIGRAWTVAKRFGGALVRRVRRELARGAAIQALQGLDDRVLRDIGVERWRIPAFVDRLLDERDPTTKEPATDACDSGRRVVAASAPHAVNPMGPVGARAEGSAR